MTTWLVACLLVSGSREVGAPFRVFDHLRLEDGLSQSSVNCIGRDATGFLWVGTQDGLNRYDGYQFRVYDAEEPANGPLPDNWITDLVLDARQRLWVGTRGGLSRYDPARDAFTTFTVADGLPDPDITALFVDRTGTLWVGTAAGLVRWTGSEFARPSGPAGAYAGRIIDVVVDRDRVWVAEEMRGLIGWRGGRERVFPYARRGDGHTTDRIGSRIEALALDAAGDLWIATASTGLYRLGPDGERLQTPALESDGSAGMIAEPITALAPARDGGIWIGTRGKIGKWDGQVFRTSSHRRDDPRSLGAGAVRAFYESPTGELWIGVAGSGLSRGDPRRQVFAHYHAGTGEPGDLPDNKVMSLFESERSVLWVGTLNGLASLQPGGDRFESHPVLAGNEILAVTGGERGSIWVGTEQAGLCRYLPAVNSLTCYKPTVAGSAPAPLIPVVFDILIDRRGLVRIAGNRTGLLGFDREREVFSRSDRAQDGLDALFLITVYEDSRGALWYGSTSVGAIRLDPEHGAITVLDHDRDDAGSLPGNKAGAFHEDRHGAMWIGTDRGLARLDDRHRVDRLVTESEGLPNSVVYAILEDDRGMLWLSTNRGLCRFDPAGGQVVTLDRNDGLQSNEFNSDSAVRLRDGRLAFGGINGFNLFDPDRIVIDPVGPRTVITTMRLFQETVRPDGDGPLDRAIEVADQIALTHRDTLVSFEIAALDFRNPAENRYAYKLEGFQDDWLTSDATRRFPTFTSLPPRTYTLRVKGANARGIWGPETTVAIRVIPPIWKTPWACALYVLAVVAALWLYIRGQRRKLAYERAAVARSANLDRLKDTFLANTSHELKTPLNGIIGLAETLLVRDDHDGETRRQLSLIASSGRRLQLLVEDILDFGSLQRGELVVQRQPLALAPIIAEVLASTRPLLEGKPVALVSRVDQDLPAVSVDGTRLRQILWNLVHNAVKFTDRGEIVITAEHDGAAAVTVSVSDTGRGIPEEWHQRIFEPFAQTETGDQRSHGGVGLGLSLTRRLVALLGGEIRLHSRPGEGAVFSFALPISDAAPVAEAPESLFRSRAAHAIAMTEAAPVAGEAAGEHRILVVDDDGVNRLVIARMLQSAGYTIIEAGDGPAALERVARGGIDLILLDIMMPGMSGYEVCRELRRRFEPNDLPIIFVTAKERLTNLRAGFEAGCNDYLTKPVAHEELLARVQLHLDLLSLNRALEDRVRERTEEARQRSLELQEKNKALTERNRELMAFDEIIRGINTETELPALIHLLLECAVDLVTGTERACFAMVDSRANQAHIRDAVGRDCEALRADHLDVRRMRKQLRATATDLAEGLVLISGERSPEPTADHAARIFILIRLERWKTAVLVLDNLGDTRAYDRVDVGMLCRFREHIASALIKARVREELLMAQRTLVEEAHQAGMAEIASEVLHHVGNNLNSIKTSIHVMEEAFQGRRPLDMLSRLSALILAQRDDLPGFFSDDPRAAHVPRALDRIAEDLARVWDLFRGESSRLVEQVALMTKVLRQQHQYAGTSGRMAEENDINALVDKAIVHEEYLLERAGIRVVTELDEVPRVPLERNKCMRMFLFLLRNAREAIEARPEAAYREIVFTSRLEGLVVVLHIRDSGIGFPPEQGERLFAQGFSTKKGHQGMGLHYAANLMAELNGQITIESEGIERGAVVTMRFPCSREP